MSSQRDMFFSEPHEIRDDQEDNTNLPNSCPVALNFVYGFLILFNWDESVKNPFKLYLRSAFSKDEIKEKCIQTKLKDEHRIKKLRALGPLPGQKISLFAKVDTSRFISII